MPENKLLTLSLEFAVFIVNLIDNVTVPKSTYMTDQLARAGTSIGANIYEAQYAQSRKDFIAKLEIALKESNETSYWLKLMFKTNALICKPTSTQKKRVEISAGCSSLPAKPQRSVWNEKPDHTGNSGDYEGLWAMRAAPRRIF